MHLFIMLKKCTNACTLRYAGTDLKHATNKAYKLSQSMRVASYVLTPDQIKTMFADQRDKLHEWSLTKFEDEIALELPLNFKKFLH